MSKGGYISANPVAEVIKSIESLYTGIPLDFFNSEELHVTIMYSLKQSTKYKIDFKNLVSKGPFLAKPTHAECWTNHDGEKILVIRLQSPDLNARHIFWNKRGLIPTYEVYSPHVTICENIPEDKLELVDDWLDMIDMQLRSMKDVWVFGREFYDIPKVLKLLSKVKFPALPGLGLSTLPIKRFKTKITDEEKADIAENGFSDKILMDVSKVGKNEKIQK